METLDLILKIAAVIGIVLFLWSVSDSLRRIADAMARDATRDTAEQPQGESTQGRIATER